MATQSATAEFRANRGPSAATAHSADDYESDPSDANSKGSAVRAIVIATLISSPFWVLVAFTIYLVL